MGGPSSFCSTNSDRPHGWLTPNSARPAYLRKPRVRASGIRSEAPSQRARIRSDSPAATPRVHTAAMSPLAIVVIVLVVVLLLLFAGGALGARRRARAAEQRFTERIAAADRALEAARAADRGWDPVLLEEAARTALERERPDFQYDKLQLVLVDDRPGKDEDRAEVAAVGDAGVIRVRVARRGDAWVGESLG